MQVVQQKQLRGTDIITCVSLQYLGVDSSFDVNVVGITWSNDHTSRLVSGHCPCGYIAKSEVWSTLGIDSILCRRVV